MPDLLEKILNNPTFTETDKALIQKAYITAELAHRGQKRLSGEEYITHPLQVANFLSELKMDATTIIAGLLHDTLEDTDISAENLKNQFGQEILFLVEGVTKLGKIEYSPDQPNKKTVSENINSLKKMFFAMAEDIRVILIKLADRYHNMETLRYQSKPAQKRIASETLEIFAPIAARLGMGNLKGQLEDMSFPYVYPDEYAWFMKNVRDKYTDRMNYIDRTKPLIKRYLTDAGINVVDLHSRAKYHYSLYNKIKMHEMDVEKVYDLVAMRIIVPDIKSCYEALGIIHKHYKPLPGLIKDYIAIPKPNGYRSLHTTIFCEKGRIVEIQIRTPDMHDHAENGIAAHWAYSESGKKMPLKADLKETKWIAQLKEFLQDMKPKDGLTGLKIDFFKNRIFAFTPKGDVKDLPEGATPIDFAYSIHTDLGHAIKGAKINGKIVPLNHKLANGDVVEIIKSKIMKPSFDWLKMVKTNEAKKKIKSWFTAEEYKRLELERLRGGKKEDERIEVSAKGGPASGGRKKQMKKIAIVITPQGIPIIQGQTGLMYKLSKCCDPKPGDKIKGYMTVNQGVSIHTIECSNLKRLSSNDKRLLSAGWSIKAR
ncbi:MAG: bifunctional (p)ppGpp synthetase/guanosine-3',5'-bis(diphosphate) 3'-pyrophosphohydrolase [Candidatus Yanofskybacteria bacterium]|nr:bifunctional (p)ppGpp synthetase/guanosine-3',5'-bis(diphosphate) 3'-pyrophosphohydrolase [Candidatus Yanofskybacteria bacterium]